MTSFHQIYSKFKGALLEGWQTGEVAAHFGPTASLESMFKYLSSLPEAQQILLPPPGDNRISRKGAVEAEKFRNEGNRFYREKKLDKALLAYNYSILAAPHPPVVDGSSNVVGNEYEVLALGYANRSALLYETDQYESALADIERAIAFGYPANRKHRLQERQAKCLLALGRAQEARQTLEEAINLLNALSLEEKEAATTWDSITKLLTKCENKSQETETTTGAYDRLYYTGPISPPDINSPQANTPCMSSALRIAYTPARGRHLVAEREIQPGEILLVEDALTAIVKLDATLRSHCSKCLRRAPIPIPCPTCSLVVFCSDKCRSVSLSSGHGAECGVLATLVALQLDPAPAIAFHVLASTNLPTLRDQVTSIRRCTGSGLKPLLQVTQDYRSLYHLEGHATARPESQLQEVAAMAYILTHILLEKCSHFLTDTSGSSITPTEEDITMVGSQLMLLILGVECNVHCTKEVEVSNNNSATSGKQTRGKEVGWAVYSGLSLINHSCIPNSLTTSLGSTKFLYSISIIPKGVEITDSYGERYVSHSRTERRKALQDHYFFCCGCAACQSDWPIYQELPEKPSLRCPSCCQVLVGFQCMICKLVCTSDNALKNGIKLYDAPKTQVQISRTWSEYSKAAAQIQLGKISAELLAKVLEMLTLLDKYTVHPNKAYISTQETLMTCFDLMGSVVYTNPTNANT
ncbi:SET and MYND domain-containing protein 4-like [Macrobrachium rosenbergii]|uniref:SET and MYND domain-containing protein 4-like n=1 Tax=Macrobrachium rosenbergii TaxID=79674 RepID=UPI0034D4287A